jgi:hypothetical protein
VIHAAESLFVQLIKTPRIIPAANSKLAHGQSILALIRGMSWNQLILSIVVFHSEKPGNKFSPYLPVLKMMAIGLIETISESDIDSVYGVSNLNDCGEPSRPLSNLLESTESLLPRQSMSQHFPVRTGACAAELGV